MAQLDIVAELRAHIGRHFDNNRTKAAAHWDVSLSFMDKIMKGERKPSQAMLDDMGYEKAPLTYRRKKKERKDE
jgi:hypothetical protein